MSRKKPTLGRGLDALLESAHVTSEIEVLEKTSSSSIPSPTKGAGEKVIRELPVEFIVRGKYQPRKDMSQEALEELARSIKQHGVMQPVMVRPVADKKYELVAGERRWRACQLAGVANIPVVIRHVSDEATLAMALIENIQREDLNPMEEAVAMARLKDQFGLTQQEVADALGKSRVTVTNLLRLNNLDNEVKRMLEHGDLEMGHARALLGLELPDQKEAARTVVAKGLSVRQTEALVRNLQENKSASGDAGKSEQFNDPDVRKLEEDLSARIGAVVELKQSAKGKGKLIINYKTLDELDGILSRIK